EAAVPVVGEGTAVAGRLGDAHPTRIEEVVRVHQAALLTGEEADLARGRLDVHHAVRRLGDQVVGRAGALLAGDHADGLVEGPRAEDLVAANVERLPQPRPVIVGGGHAVDRQADPPRVRAEAAAEDAGAGRGG